MKKAKVSTLKGTITEAFEPFHAELLNASSLEEVTASSLASVLKKYDGRTGTAQASGAQAQRAGQQAGASPSKVVVSKAFGGAEAAAVGRQHAELVSDAVREAVAAVRSDAEACAWCLLANPNPSPNPNPGACFSHPNPNPNQVPARLLRRQGPHAAGGCARRGRGGGDGAAPERGRVPLCARAG